MAHSIIHTFTQSAVAWYLTVPAIAAIGLLLIASKTQRSHSSSELSFITLFSALSYGALLQFAIVITTDECFSMLPTICPPAMAAKASWPLFILLVLSALLGSRAYKIRILQLSSPYHRKAYVIAVSHLMVVSTAISAAIALKNLIFVDFILSFMK